MSALLSEAEKNTQWPDVEWTGDEGYSCISLWKPNAHHDRLANTLKKESSFVLVLVD